ncbi:Superfamily II DNA or RNA helicase (SSL2) [Fructobacillus fructosus]|uniref:Superfamily II DNA or RNA helicase (SSL2) n=1 Tax=Fructobacillus fructosus TaxID=1631 RepID=A0ABN9YY50_9LACO|nr:Superfamily II DNA or RNA helicase (SSL2) [Fructobacillus fructosus]
MVVKLAKSNFEFLKMDDDTTELYGTASEAERTYMIGAYGSEFTSIRKVAERIAQLVVDFKMQSAPYNPTFNEYLKLIQRKQLMERGILDIFFELKQLGNRAAHHTGDGHDQPEALEGLKKLHFVAAWFYNTYISQSKDSMVDVMAFAEPVEESMYSTAEKKLIYVQTADNSNGMWPAFEGAEKVGDATVDDYVEEDTTPNSDFLRKSADHRINQYMNTGGVPHILNWAELAYRKSDKQWFRDAEVHRVLERSGYKHAENLDGNEWFDVDLETVKKAIRAVKDGKSAIDAPAAKTEAKEIVLRPEQQDAVDKTKKVFKKENRMLWNAKMRFGKTLTALQLVKDKNFEKVLIMTHRPVVSDSWYDDFYKIKMPDSGYEFGSKTQGLPIEELLNQESPFVYFASIQDLRGSKAVGGKQGEKNEEIFGTDWNLVIIDEGHEGTQTELAQAVLKAVVKKDTKLLTLSGTPFNLLDHYQEDQVYTWDYTMEQKAKLQWSIDKPDQPNPYASLPKVSMYTFEMNEKAKYEDETKAFNFKEFFKVDDFGKFVHQSDVWGFLNNITTPDDKTNYPFSTPEFRKELRHTLWLMPGVKEAKAFEELLKQHPVFAEYDVVNVVDDLKDDQRDTGYTKEDDLERVRNAISNRPDQTKTITLTVRKLTTGVNIPQWNAVVFLSNTNSPATYLQAAFRAQTPYSDEYLGMKTNAYIFDFAPDRALTVMTQSANVSKRSGKQDEKQLQDLLNFLPIVGQGGQTMIAFDVDRLLTQIKRVFAEKAVRSGFDDDSLYSDDLLIQLDEADQATFNDIKAIVGATKKEKQPLSFDISSNGLTNEEYDQAEKAKKKKKKERTAEEEKALDKIKKAKEQKRTTISVLRGISIRIPMMIYGMKVDLSEDIDIETFIQKVDQESWNEFMPQGITKDKFRDIIKYYDAQVFIEAGRIIRQKVKALDNSDPIERAEEIALIFSSFKNPDKETVLTPWRVVNMQMSTTLGGLSFFDDQFEYTSVDGTRANHWVENNESNGTFKPDTKFLEINSKTGLYPLYAAASLYSKAFDRLNESTAGKFSSRDENKLWRDILSKNIFVVAKTPMAKTITERTLAGYQSLDTNVEYIENIVATAKENIDDGVEKIEKAFNDMKFDVVIGNPPYQAETAKKETDNGQKAVTNVFQHFQEMADQLAKNYTSLIYPGGRWIHQSGKGMKGFGLNQINDPRLSKIIFFKNANEVFDNVSLSDGLSIVLKDQNKKTHEFDYEYHDGKTVLTSKIQAPGEKILPLNPKDQKISDKIDLFVGENNYKYLFDSIFNQKMFGIESDFAERNPDKVRLLEDGKFDKNTEIKLLTNDKAGKMGRATWFVADKSVITQHQNLIYKYKVAVSSANAGGQKRDNKIAIIDNYSAFGRSRLGLKAFDTLSEAENFLKYAKTYIIRFAFLLTDESLTSLGKEVPDILDYTSNNKLIDFNKDVDSQLSNLLGLTKDEFDYIVEVVDHIRG